MNSRKALLIDLDGAWPRDGIEGAEYFDATAWGPKLRFSAPPREIEFFYRDIQPHLAPFTLFGSGEFHHLTALWLRQFDEPLTLISFDNHPDWDVRPPRWGCGGWVNRALELPCVRNVFVWGCGNFEFNWPHRLFANHQAIASGRMVVRPWAERLHPRVRARWDTITRDNWRTQFADFAAQLSGTRVYVTIDMDCLCMDDAVTNWEQGLFTAGEIAHALRELRARNVEIAGGDVCGAWSRPDYARWRQKIAATFDRPRLPEPDERHARELNVHSLRVIWPALLGEMVG